MRHADRPTVEEELFVDAPPERVWPLISDIAFFVEASDELQAVHWSSGEGAVPAVGRCFVGTNSNRYFGEWQTTSTVIECDEPRVFAWAVGDVDEPNTTWRFSLRPEGDGTVVTQWVCLGPGPSGIGIAIARIPDKEEKIVAGRMREFRDAMRANLAAVRAHAEKA